VYQLARSINGIMALCGIIMARIIWRNIINKRGIVSISAQ